MEDRGGLLSHAGDTGGKLQVWGGLERARAGQDEKARVGESEMSKQNRMERGGRQ